MKQKIKLKFQYKKPKKKYISFDEFNFSIPTELLLVWKENSNTTTLQCTQALKKRNVYRANRIRKGKKSKYKTSFSSTPIVTKETTKQYESIIGPGGLELFPRN